jgi:hypothetical protein
MPDILTAIKLIQEIKPYINSTTIVIILFCLAFIFLFWKYVHKKDLDSIKLALKAEIDDKLKSTTTYMIDKLEGSHKHIEIMVASLKELIHEHAKSEEKTLESIENKAYGNAERIEALSTQITRITTKLPDTKIEDIKKIYDVIKLSSISVSTKVLQYIEECKFGSNPIDADADTAVSIAVNDVQADRLVWHNQLVTDGVKPDLIALWEKCENMLFKDFAFRIMEFVKDCNSFHGNGHTKRYYEMARESLERYFYETFTQRLQLMVVD